MSDTKFIKLIAADGTEFYLSEATAFMSDRLQENLMKRKDATELRLAHVTSNVVTIVVEFLHYKRLNQGLPPEKRAPFAFDDAKAIEVLLATNIFNV